MTVRRLLFALVFLFGGAAQELRQPLQCDMAVSRVDTTRRRR
ncbi:hypothetical protein [Roseateles sp.]